MTSKTEPTPLPWTIGANGDLLDGQGQLVLDGYCLPDHETMVLIVHRVNHYEHLLNACRLVLGHLDGSTGEVDAVAILQEALLCGEGRGENTTI